MYVGARVGSFLALAIRLLALWLWHQNFSPLIRAVAATIAETVTFYRLYFPLKSPMVHSTRESVYSSSRQYYVTAQYLDIPHYTSVYEVGHLHHASYKFKDTRLRTYIITSTVLRSSSSLLGALAHRRSRATMALFRAKKCFRLIRRLPSVWAARASSCQTQA